MLRVGGLLPIHPGCSDLPGPPGPAWAQARAAYRRPLPVLQTFGPLGSPNHLCLVPNTALALHVTPNLLILLCPPELPFLAMAPDFHSYPHVHELSHPTETPGAPSIRAAQRANSGCCSAAQILPERRDTHSCSRWSVGC